MTGGVATESWRPLYISHHCPPARGQNPGRELTSIRSTRDGNASCVGLASGGCPQHRAAEIVPA